MLATRPPTLARPSAHDLVAPPLTGGARVEVCITRAGLAGMVAAYLLTRERRSVMVVDDGPIGGAPTGAEVAHLASALEQPYAQLERLHGANGARLAAQSGHAALDALEAIVRRERIACEFERLDGYAFGLDAEEEARAARRAGVRGAEAVDAPPVEGIASLACVRYPAQAQFHPAKLVAGLTRATLHGGGRVHCGVGTKSIGGRDPACLVTTGGHRIEADIIVSQQPGARVARVVQVLALRIPRGAVARALYWDYAGPPRCARLRSNGHAELLLVAGEEPAPALEAWARTHFPRAGEVVQRFTAGLPCASDLFALTGSEGDANGHYVSTSSWGTAMTRATIAGMVIRDYVDGAGTRWDELYTASSCYAGELEGAIRSRAL